MDLHVYVHEHLSTCKYCYLVSMTLGLHTSVTHEWLVLIRVTDLYNRSANQTRVLCITVVMQNLFVQNIDRKGRSSLTVDKPSSVLRSDSVHI